MSDVQQLSLLEADASTTLATGSRVLLTQAQLAAAFGLAPSTVSRWPLQPVERRGREVFYCLREAIQHRFGELDKLDLGQERARLARVQSERQELQLRRERGELVPVAVAADVLGRHISHCRARLLTLPDQAAPRVAGAGAREAATILRKLVFQALNELAGVVDDLTPATPPPAVTEAAEAAPDTEAPAGDPPALPLPDTHDPELREQPRKRRRKRRPVEGADATSTEGELS